MKKDCRSMMFSDIEKNDIYVGNGVGKALPKGGWIFPGKVVVTSRFKAHKIAERIDVMIRGMEHNQAKRG